MLFVILINYWLIVKNNLICGIFSNSKYLYSLIVLIKIEIWALYLLLEESWYIIDIFYFFFLLTSQSPMDPELFNSDDISLEGLRILVTSFYLYRYFFIYLVNLNSIDDIQDYSNGDIYNINVMPSDPFQEPIPDDEDQQFLFLSSNFQNNVSIDDPEYQEYDIDNVYRK